MNLDEVITYNQMALMSLRSRSHVKASMLLTRADHLLIHNYIRSLLNIMLLIRSGGGLNLNVATCEYDTLSSELSM